MAASPAVAQTSYPMLMSIHPVAAQTGTTAEHTVESRYDLFGTWAVLVSGDGVTGEAVNPEVKKGAKPPTLTQFKVRFTVAPDALPGVREVRLATPRGVSTIGQLVVVRDPLAVEDPKNDTFETAQPIEVPATICGIVEKNEDVDFYRFHVAEPTSLVFHVRSMRLQDKIHDLQAHVDPILALRNASGATVATSDNAFFGDPFLVYHCEPGDYALEIRDVRYTGNKYWTYAVEVHARPFVTQVHPLAVARGASTPVELVGANLSDGPGPALDVPADHALGPHEFIVDVDGATANPFTAIVSDQPLSLETDADDDSPETAQLVTIPGGVNGRIDRESDVDCFAFDARKGERYDFEVLARRYGSDLDSTLRILEATGKQLAENDDSKRSVSSSSDSWIQNWVAPADGRYTLEIRDLHLRGGPGFVYHVAVTRAVPDFDLFLDTDKTQLAPGTAGQIYVRVERRNGFDAPIALHVDGLPAGVTAHLGHVPAGKKTDGCIVLEAAGDAKFAVADVVVRGTATVAGDNGATAELTAIATPLQEIYQPGGGRGHWPVLGHTLHVGEPGDLRGMTLSATEVTLAPGGTQRIDVEIERAPGFEQTVNLDLMFRHLSGVHGDSLPEGVTIDAKNSQMRLAGKTTKGHVTMIAAADAKPVDRQVVPVMANIALNFVMKATYAAPLVITVTATPE